MELKINPFVNGIFFLHGWARCGGFWKRYFICFRKSVKLRQLGAFGHTFAW